MEQAERIAGNLALVIFLTIALSASYLLDGPDDVTTAKNVAADVQAAQAAAVQVAQVK